MPISDKGMSTHKRKELRIDTKPRNNKHKMVDGRLIYSPKEKVKKNED